VSRIGKQPITLPEKVTVKINGGHIKVSGPLGGLERNLKGISVGESEGVVTVTPLSETRTDRALWGLGRTLINNIVLGVSVGYSRTLEIHGVGYKADARGKVLNLTLGHSHPINYPLPEGISAEVDKKQTTVILKGIDKELLGQVAAKIRSFRPPEPYKGKGVRYQGEHIRRKAGKAAK
jgi:large subunit ribosomal protein L6